MLKFAPLFLFVAVAAFGQPQLDSLSQTSGKPGAVLTAKPVNFPGFIGNPFVLFVFPNGLAVPAAADELPDGSLQFLVPYFIDQSDPKGYLTGNCRIALPLNGKRVADIPFVIEPLAPVTDPAARFRELVSSLTAAAREVFDNQRAIEDAGDAVDALQKITDSREQRLLAFADEIGQSGKAKLPLDLLSADSSATVDVSARDLEHLMSMAAEIPPPPPRDGAQLQARKSRFAVTQGCIADAFGPHPNAWDECLDTVRAGTVRGAAALETGQALQLVFERALSHGSPRSLSYGSSPRLTGPCQLSPQNITPVIVAASLLNIINAPFLICKLYPVKPVSITAHPIPDPIPVGSASSTGNKGTELRLRTEPWWTPEFTVDTVLRRAYDQIQMEALDNIDLECHSAILVDFHRLADQMFQSARPILLDALNSVQSKQPPFREVPVYKCDIEELFPEDLSGLNRNPSADDDENLRWGLEGVRPGSYRVRFSPIRDKWPTSTSERWGHINVFAPDAPGQPCNAPPAPKFFVQWKEEYRQIPKCVSVTVEGGETAVKVRAGYIFSYQDEGPKNPVTYTPPRLVDTFLTLEENAYGAKSSAQIKKVNDNNWQIIQQLNGAPTSQRNVTTTWNRLDLELTHRPGPRKIRVKIKSDISGTCQGLDVALGSKSFNVEGRNGCAADTTLEEFSPSSSTGVVQLLVRAVVLGGTGPGFGTGSGQIVTDIEFLPESQ